MYIRWLGAFGSFEGMKSFDFEFHRKTECCAEYIDQQYSWTKPELGAEYQYGVGLLCNPKGVVRTFKNDAWSQLNKSGLLERGKDGICHAGYYNRVKKSKHHSEAWVKPGSFIGIVVYMQPSCMLENFGYHQGVHNLDGKTKRMLKTASEKYGVPVYQWKIGYNRKNHFLLKEITF